MPRPQKFSDDDIWSAASDLLLERKCAPEDITPSAVRKRLKGGDANRIASTLTRWRAEQTGTSVYDAAQENAVMVAERAMKGAIARAVEGSAAQIVDEVAKIVRDELAHENEEIRLELQRARDASIEARAARDAAERNELDVRDRARRLEETLDLMRTNCDGLRDELAKRKADIQHLNARLKSQSAFEAKIAEMADDLRAATSAVATFENALAVGWFADGCLGRLRLRKSPKAAVMSLQEWNERAQLGASMSKADAPIICVGDIPLLQMADVSEEVEVLVRVDDAEDGTARFALCETAIEQARAFNAFRPALHGLFSRRTKTMRHG